MTYSPNGKHVRIDPTSPEAWGICDYSGFPFLVKDLVKQMEWRGNALVWTGFLVGRPYVDTPNEQNRPPILPPDPIPVKMPRLPQGTIETFSSNTLANFGQISLQFCQIGTTEYGALAPTATQREELLEENNSPSLVANGGPNANDEYVNPNVALQNLLSFRWMSP